MTSAFMHTPPLALYIHLPWCVEKCPYCDFNSHKVKDSLPEELYAAALMQELMFHSETLQHRPLVSIFFGGGTPSLFSGKSIDKILNGAAKYLTFSPDIEITLEANPGTVDQEHFHDYRSAGVNRLSLGIQSLQPEKLKILGRIHDRNQALNAVRIARQSGFDNFNLDIMYGLPQQTIPEALKDLQDALNLAPTHFSWYQLTIEPNTLFYHQRPPLPADDIIWEMQIAGQDFLQKNNLAQYEVSAYATPEKECVHNKNYWEFGDYLGIGAGAHSKISDAASGIITRFAQVRHPKEYLAAAKRHSLEVKSISEQALIFEFMLNALRLTNGVPAALFTERTGLPLSVITPQLAAARLKGLMEKDTAILKPTKLGRQFLNDLIEIFL
jgi:oxygen-independent coproporphyrinogen-3 oxidase